MRDPGFWDYVLVFATLAAIGGVAWIQHQLKQAEYRRLVRHFISLDRIAEHAGVDCKDFWLGPIRRRGVVEYGIDFKGDLDGDRSGAMTRIVKLDGSEDYREIERGLAEHHRQALENKRHSERKKGGEEA